MEDALVGIRDGSFAREWAADQQNGYPHFLEYQRQLSDSQFGNVEREVLEEVTQAVDNMSPSLAATS